MNTIIVVDDNPLHANMAAKIVSKVKPEADVKIYNDPFLALSDALKDHPDLLILDFMMPKMDGLQLLREIRKNGVYSQAIIMSAFLRKVSTKMVPENNVAAIVGKPYSAQDFVKTVEKVLEKDV